MRYKLAYYAEVANDISDAKVWYYTQLPGLEKRFAKDIKKTLTKLKITPFVHAIHHKNIRIAHPDIFPYAIHYFIDEGMKRIVVIGVVHNNRAPDFLNKRISAD